MITAGMDIGSSAAKAVLFQKDGQEGKILSQAIIRTGGDSVETARKVVDGLLKDTGLALQDIDCIVATGYGRVMVPFANKNISEISCHAKGSNWYFPEARTILDMGGQDCKAIRCDVRGKVVNFVMNDKCAAGAGRSMEVAARLLDIPLEEIGELALEIVNEPAPISSTCVLFARGEILALRSKGVHKNDILAGACESLVKRVLPLLSRVGVKADFVISGGIAKNIGVVKRVGESLGHVPKICPDPQIIGALGAAIFAQEILQRKG